MDVGVYLADDLLVKTDRASMAHSLEARVPFCDVQLAEFALSLPDELRVRRFDKKRLLRRAVEPLLPREIVHGRKQGFSIPVAAWLRHELRPTVDELLSPDAVRRQGVFDPAVVSRLVERHAAGEDHGRPLWNLLVFMAWHARWAVR